MNRPLLPTCVSEPPPAVPGFIVTCSRITLLDPIISLVGSPLYFKSCGGSPTQDHVSTLTLSPTVVWSATTTRRTTSTTCPSATAAPPTQSRPTRSPPPPRPA